MHVILTVSAGYVTLPWSGDAALKQHLANSLWHSVDSTLIRQSRNLSPQSWTTHPLVKLGRTLSNYNSDEILLDSAFDLIRSNLTAVADHMAKAGTYVSCGPLQSAVYNLNDILSDRSNLLDRVTRSNAPVDTSSWFVDSSSYFKLLLTYNTDTLKVDPTVVTALSLFDLEFKNRSPQSFGNLKEAWSAWLRVIYDAPVNFGMFSKTSSAKREALKRQVASAHAKLREAVYGVRQQDVVNVEVKIERREEKPKADPMYWYYAMSSILR